MNEIAQLYIKNVEDNITRLEQMYGPLPDMRISFWNLKDFLSNGKSIHVVLEDKNELANARATINLLELAIGEVVGALIGEVNARKRTISEAFEVSREWARREYVNNIVMKYKLRYHPQDEI